MPAAQGEGSFEPSVHELPTGAQLWGLKREQATLGESATVRVTAGWDGRAVLWDARAGGAVASAHGSHVCGQALDASRGETEVILGSWREADALQVRGTLRMRVVRSAERSQCSDPAQLTPRLARGRYGTSVRGMRRAQ